METAYQRQNLFQGTHFINIRRSPLCSITPQGTMQKHRPSTEECPKIEFRDICESAKQRQRSSAFHTMGCVWYCGSVPAYRLVGFASPIMWLADDCWIPVGRGVLLSRVKSGVQDAVGTIGSIWESHRRCTWTSHWRRAYRAAHRPTGTVTAARWPILILAPGRLSLEAISIEACKRSHKSHLAVF